MSMGAANDPLVGATLSQGRYRVLAKLGEGGMGSVYSAHDTNLDTTVVVKMPRRAMLEDPEIAQRFAIEVRALVRLRHPHIVRVTEIGEHNDAPFAVMEYLSGGSLEDRYGLGGDTAATAADPRELESWLPTIAAALDFAHAQGYVHRDVKPPNILFDAQGHAFLGDFGVAKLIAASEGRAAKNVTGTGMVLGTPGYMAPEVILGKVPDGRADLYALGIVVYEVLTGRRPFGDAVGTAVLVMQTTTDPEPVHRIRPEVPLALAAAVGRSMNRDPGVRYHDCASFAREALAEAATYQPARSRPGTVAVASAGTVRLVCPSCTRALKIPTTAAGKAIRCPACSTKVRVAEDMTALALFDQMVEGGTISISALNTMSMAAPRPAASPRTVAEGMASLPPSERVTYEVVPPAPAPVSRLVEPPAPPTSLRDDVKASAATRGAWTNPGTLVWIGGSIAAVLVIGLGVLSLARRTPEPEPLKSPVPPVVLTSAPTEPKARQPESPPPPVRSVTSIPIAKKPEQAEPKDDPIALMVPTTPTAESSRSARPRTPDVVPQTPLVVDIRYFKDHPEKFVGRTVVPDTFVKVGTMMKRVSGFPTISVRDPSDRPIVERDLREFPPTGPLLVLDETLADNLQRLIGETRLRQDASAKTLGLLKMHVERVSLNDQPRLAAKVVELQLLPEWNKLKIANGIYQGAFHVLKVTDSPGVKINLINNGDEWLPKLGPGWVAKHAKEVRDYQKRLMARMNRQQAEAQMNQAFSAGMNAAFARSAAESAAAQRALSVGR
jgi:hypothetical protein